MDIFNFRVSNPFTQIENPVLTSSNPNLLDTRFTLRPMNLPPTDLPANTKYQPPVIPQRPDVKNRGSMTWPHGSFDPRVRTSTERGVAAFFIPDANNNGLNYSKVQKSLL